CDDHHTLPPLLFLVSAPMLGPSLCASLRRSLLLGHLTLLSSQLRMMRLDAATAQTKRPPRGRPSECCTGYSSSLGDSFFARRFCAFFCSTATPSRTATSLMTSLHRSCDAPSPLSAVTSAATASLTVSGVALPSASSASSWLRASSSSMTLFFS